MSTEYDSDSVNGSTKVVIVVASVDVCKDIHVHDQIVILFLFMDCIYIIIRYKLL